MIQCRFKLKYGALSKVNGVFLNSKRWLCWHTHEPTLNTINSRKLYSSIMINSHVLQLINDVLQHKYIHLLLVISELVYSSSIHGFTLTKDNLACCQTG